MIADKSFEHQPFLDMREGNFPFPDLFIEASNYFCVNFSLASIGKYGVLNSLADVILDSQVIKLKQSLHPVVALRDFGLKVFEDFIFLIHVIEGDN